ncbi:MAG: hypothetical protein F4Y12_01150 [Acidimicrobiaceae bacterium]|nr:hypothetical protein [Acidimicrobiaceae bacterium]MYH77944.1 hypothetical protein [Acidimicrobiaceae bacterium]
MIPELTLAGPPRDRGRQHGEELRGLIAAAVDAWFEDLAPRTEPGAFVAEVAASGLLAAAEAHAPDLVAEVAGIAEGAGQGFDTMFAWQLIDECWWYLDDLEAEGAAERSGRERCSALAVNHAGQGFVAQTQDLYRHCDGTQVMLRYLDQSGLEVLVPSLAGLLALNGVNSAGVAVCITTLSQLAHGSDGIASGLLVPMLLRCTSIDEALALLRRVPIASGNSFVIGVCHRSLAVEVSSKAMRVVADGERALHTNHTLALEAVHTFGRFENSVQRLAQLDEQVRPGSTLDDLAAVYSSGAVCQSRATNSPLMSVGTMIFDLGDELACHYAPGPLDTDELVTYRMKSRAGAAI